MASVVSRHHERSAAAGGNEAPPAQVPVALLNRRHMHSDFAPEALAASFSARPRDLGDDNVSAGAAPLLPAPSPTVPPLAIRKADGTSSARKTTSEEREQEERQQQQQDSAKEEDLDLEEAAVTTDLRVNFDPLVYPLPRWLRILDELRKYRLSGQHLLEAGIGIREAAAQALRDDVLLVRAALQQGMIERCFRFFYDDACTMPVESWMHGAAPLEELAANAEAMLLQKVEAVTALPPVGRADVSALVGLQVPDNAPEASRSIRQAILIRTIGDGNMLTSPERVGDLDFALLAGAAVIHDEFVQDNDHPELDPSALSTTDARMLTALDDGQQAELRRTVAININHLRFADHRSFTTENLHVAALLDAYEKYNLLQSNLMAELKSRKHYERLLAAQGPPQADSGYTAAIQHAYREASELEGAFLREMVRAWNELCREREMRGGAAVQLSFALRRDGDAEGAEYLEGSGESILNFSPVLSGMDASPAAENGYRVTVHARTTGDLLLVGSTEFRARDTTFMVPFNETIELMLTAADPTEIRLDLHDTEVPSHPIAQISIPTSRAHCAMLLPFHTADVFAPGPPPREVRGVLSLSTTWTTATGLTISDIENMFLSGHADPRDPRNEPYVRQLRDHYENAQGGIGGERSSAAGERGKALASGDLASAGPQEWERQQLLHLYLLKRRWEIVNGIEGPRDEVEKHFVDLPVPADHYEAVKLLRKIQAEVRMQRSGDKNLKNWQQRLRNMKLSQNRNVTLDDHVRLARIITVPPLPSFSRLFEKAKALLVPRSALNPPREVLPEADEIDRAKLMEEKGGSQIIVHVMKASDLPRRTDGTEVEPFIAAEFINEIASSRTETGQNPCYFETLRLDFNPIDFEDDTLSLIDDEIIVGIYDQVRIILPPVRTVEGADVNLTHCRNERRLIGFVKIPFFTIYQSPRANIEGVFNILTPRWIMGYRMGATPPTIHLFVSLWPPMSAKEEPPIADAELVEKVMMSTPTGNMQVVHSIALDWRMRSLQFISEQLTANPLAKRREVNPFVPDSKGKLVLMSNYIRPCGVNPPPTVRSIPEAIRFVSMIPFVVDLMAWDDSADVWSTNSEYLSMGVGDYEEMALLLLHYIRHFAPDGHSYLIIGEGDIFKQATYVIYRSSSWKLIDPRTGNVFDTTDPRCGLSEVGMVVSHDQMWANIQLSGTPYRMTWELGDSRYWCPLFEASHYKLSESLSVECVQDEQLKYTMATDRQCVELEDAAMKTLRAALKEWRKGKQPVFQTRVGAILREVLVEMEKERCEFANFHQAAVSEKHQWAQDNFADWKVVGVPVNCPYSDDGFETLLRRVKETAVHEVGTDNVKFAIAVYVHPFTSTIFSLWCYAVALLPSEDSP